MNNVTPIRQAADLRLLTVAQVAKAFQVDPKTVTRWAKERKLTSLRTLGGHRRFLEAEVLMLLGENRQERRS